MPDQIRQLEERIKKIEFFMDNFNYSDRLILSKLLQFQDERNIQVGTNKGTSFGTATGQKVSVYGVTPVVQAGAITAPSGGGTIDSQARTAIGSIITAIKNFGITA